MDHLGGHNGSGGRAVSADKAGGAEDRVGGGGRGLVLGQDCGGAQECEVRARHSQALEEGLRLLAEDERVVTKVGSLRLLDPSLQSMQVLGHRILLTAWFVAMLWQSPLRTVKSAA